MGKLSLASQGVGWFIITGSKHGFHVPPTASAPQHSTGAPCAAGGQAILSRRQLPCDMVGASDGDNQDNSQARQSDRMAQPGNPVASPSPSLQLWFLSLLQFYVQCSASFSFFFFLPCPRLKIIISFPFFFSFFFSFSHAPKPKVKTSYYFHLFCLFFLTPPFPCPLPPGKCHCLFSSFSPLFSHFPCPQGKFLFF